MKCCVIVGAGPQMGVSIAHRFAREGFTIALVSRNADKLVTELRQLEHMKDYDVHGFPANAADPESLRTTFAHIEDQLKAPDVLVYNAAGYGDGLPSTVDVAVLLDAVRVNLIGAVVSAQWAVPAMREAGMGTILFTGGGLAINPRPEYVALSTGKAALRNYVNSLAKEVTADGIKVGIVTVAGYIHKEDGFDPDDIADKYWQLHTAALSVDNWEIIYKGT
ncbi:MAG: short-chain dehydrogenase [Anaerolineaceae bacterium]|nr:short-chain dehydrogenase [Anaerolineaceae bacterium]